MLKVFFLYIGLELKILCRSRADWIQPLLLYLLTISLFGITLSGEKEILTQVGGVILWVAILFAMLTLSENMLRKDIEEGWLNQLKISPTPLWLFLLGKGVAYWLVIGLGLLASLPIIAVWLYFSLNMALGLAFIYFIATPALVVLLLFGLSLTVGLPKPGLLLGLLLLPLCIPILILGQSAVRVLQANQWPVFESALLGAITIVTVMFLPILSAFSLEQTCDE
tara:strand:+ start:120038 stop:120709 length:672 start_codon:yes stop_codon:yes gene_type:complete